MENWKEIRFGDLRKELKSHLHSPGWRVLLAPSTLHLSRKPFTSPPTQTHALTGCCTEALAMRQRIWLRGVGRHWWLLERFLMGGKLHFQRMAWVLSLLGLQFFRSFPFLSVYRKKHFCVVLKAQSAWTPSVWSSACPEAAPVLFPLLVFPPRSLPQDICTGNSRCLQHC